MVVTMLSLVISALLVALLLGTMLHSSSTTKTGVANNPAAAAADGIEAQQALSTGLNAATTAASGNGGYGSLQITALSASQPSTSFVSGPSSNASTVSVSISAEGDGSITMADRSSDGICWLLWRSAESGTWYGAQTGLSSCTAPTMASAPATGPVSSTAIGWRQGSFPPA